MEARRIAIPVVVLALMATSATPASSATLASVSFRPAGADTLADVAAASRVRETRWEPRGENADENQRRPSEDQLEDFRRRSTMANRGQVTGRYRGTTDEIIQWAAHKWGFDPDLLRAVAYVESRWRMSMVGDRGLSFGLFQMKRTDHCCVPLSSRYTAFNADYYGGILRSYFDGREKWLNDVERGERYRAGDLWGSVGAWYAGRWRTHAAEDYISKVQRVLRDEPWRERGF